MSSTVQSGPAAGAEVGKMTPRYVQAQYRHKQAMKLRARGKSWDDIAEACDYRSTSAARRAVTEAIGKFFSAADMAQVHSLINNEYDELSVMLRARIDAAYMLGEDDIFDRLIGRYVQVLKERAVLNRAEPPKQVELTINGQVHIVDDAQRWANVADELVIGAIDHLSTINNNPLATTRAGALEAGDRVSDYTDPDDEVADAEVVEDGPQPTMADLPESVLPTPTTPTARPLRI